MDSKKKLANYYTSGTIENGDAVRLFKDLSRSQEDMSQEPSFIWLVKSINHNRLRSRQLTMLLHSCASFLPWRPDDTFLHHTFRSVQTQLEDFDPMGLTQVIWSAAKMNIVLPPFLVAPIMIKIQNMAPRFNPQDVANILWGFARQKTTTPSVTRVGNLLLERAAAVAFRTKPMEIANIFWGEYLTVLLFDF